MRKQEYRQWLDGKIKPASIKDRISRCTSVESSLNIDLDDEYKKDEGKKVLAQLHYTINDLRMRKPLPGGFHFKDGVNVNQRMTDMRSAVVQYFAFCKSCPPNE